MLTLDDLVVKEGNGKVILLNPENGHWVRIRKEQYAAVYHNKDKQSKFEEYVNDKYGLLNKEKDLRRKSVYFAVTGCCNLQCEFCTMNSGPHVSRKNDLTLSEIKNMLIPKLLEINPRKIVITGGEPLMRPDILEILDLFSEAFEPRRIVLQTNGLLLSTGLVEKIAGKIGILEISIENIFEDKKLLDKMENIFKSAKVNGIVLSLSFVVDQETERYLEKAIDMCHKYHAFLTTRIVTLVGRAKENNKKDKMREDYNVLKTQLKIVQYILEREYLEEELTSNYSSAIQPQRSCGAFGNIIAIHPDGTTFMCSNFKDHQFSMGNIREHSMEELCDDLQKKIENPELKRKFCVDEINMCKECEIKYFCPGPCAAEVAENGGVPEFVDSKCMLRKALLIFSMFYYDNKKSKKENLQFLVRFLKDILRGQQSI